MPEWKPPADAKWTPPADAKESWSPPEDAVEASPMDYAELVAGGAVNTLTSTPLKMLGAVDETLNRYVYNPLGIGAGDNYISPATKAGNATQEFFQPNVSQEAQNSFGGQVAQGLGTGLAMMATGGASALGKGGATTLEGALTAPTTSLGRIALDEAKQVAISPTGVLGGAMTAVPEYEAAKAAGVSEDELFGILARNYLVGQTEALPIQNMMGRVNRLTGGTIYQKLLNTGKIMSRGAVEEGVQEGLQTYLSNEIAKGSYDPDRDPLWGVMRAATVGGFVGFLLPGIGAAINAAPESERPKLEKKVREIESLQQATELVNDASKELQVGNGIDEQIDQDAKITDEQANAVQSQQVSELEIHQNEDEQKRLEKLAKENDKENKEWISGEERVGQTTEQKEFDQGTGEETLGSGGILQTPQALKEEYEVIPRDTKGLVIGKEFNYAPNKNLSEPEISLETSFGQKLNDDYEDYKKQYQEKFGNVFDADLAKELSPEYVSNPQEFANAVHNPSSSFVQRMYTDALKQPAPKGKENKVTFIIGGAASGKSTFVENSGVKDKSQIVYTSFFGDLQLSKNQINRALNAGKDVDIKFIHRPKEEAYQSMLERAKGNRRAVPKDIFDKSYAQSVSTVSKLKDTYRGNKRVNIDVVENNQSGVDLQSPEYIAADNAYQEAAAKLRQSPNIEIGPKGITPLNQEGIDEFRAMTELWQKRDNIRIQELKTPKPRGSATIKMTPGAALKQQVQTFYRGVAKGVTKGSEMKSQLLSKVQEAIKEFPLSPKQVSSILTKVKKTNLFTPGSISRLNDYIGKVADDAQLAEKYDQAHALRKKIKGKKSSNNLSWQERDALKKFSAVDPDYVDIDQYLGQAQHVHDTLLKPVANRAALDTKSINDYISSVPDTNQLRAQERQEKLADELGLTPEEAAILLSDQGEEQTPADKREAVRQQLKEVADQAKADLDDAEGGTPRENEVLKNLKELNTDKLTPEELRNYVRVVDRIVANGDFAGSGELMEAAKADKDFNQLLEKSKDWKILNLNAGEVGIDSLPMAVQAITGLPKEAAEFQSAMGTKEIGDASVEALTEEESLVDTMKRLEKDHKKAFTNDSIVRQGIYSELIRYQEDADPNEALAQNKQLIEATIAAHRSAGESKEADKIAQLYKPFQDALTIDDVQRIMTQVDPDGKAVMDESQKFFEKYYDKIAEYNNIYFNEPTKKIINYTGPRKWLSSNGIDVSADDFINGLNLDSGIPTEYKIGRPKQTSSAKQVNNQAPPNAMLNFNKHVVMSNGIRKTLFDAHAVGPLLRLVRNSRKKELLNVLGAREGDDKSIQKAADLQKKLFGKGGVATEFVAAAANKKIPDQFDKEVSKILSPLRKFGYTLSLSGISQIPKQATVLTNVALQLGGDVDLLPIADVVKGSEDIKNMLKGESISLRGSQKSNFSLGEVTSEKQMSEFSKRVNKFIDKGFEGWGGIKPLTKTDTGMAQLTWLAFYKKYLRDNNIDFKGWKEENNLRGEAERKAARAYAKQRTDVLQVTSNPHELGKWIKNQGAGAQILKALLIPYGSFNANTKARLWQDWRAMTTGNKEQRSAAAKDLGASLIESAAFHSVSLGLKIYVWSLLGQAMLSAFNLPDDPRREKRTWENAVKTWRTNVVLDALPVLMTSPVESKVAVPLMNDMADRMLKYKDKNTMFYKYQSAEDDVLGQISELGGPYAVGPTKAIHWANLVGDWATGTKDVDGRERPLTPEQKRFLSMLLVAYSLHGAGYLPSDVINTIDKEYKNQQPGRRK